MEKRTQRFAEDLRLEFRSENEFQHKLAEMELLVKAQVTEEEEAEDGGNDKGKSPGKNGGKDNTGKKGDSKGKITFTTWIKSGIGWVGSATPTGYTHQLKDCWRGNMEKGQPCYRLNTIDGKKIHNRVLVENRVQKPQHAIVHRRGGCDKSQI